MKNKTLKEKYPMYSWALEELVKKLLETENKKKQRRTIEAIEYLIKNISEVIKC